MSTKITITCPACRKLTSASDVEPDTVSMQNCNVCYVKIDVQRTKGGTLIIGLAPNADKGKPSNFTISMNGSSISGECKTNTYMSEQVNPDIKGWMVYGEPDTMTHSERNAIIDAYIAIINSAESREDYETCALYRDKLNALKIK